MTDLASVDLNVLFGLPEDPVEICRQVHELVIQTHEAQALGFPRTGSPPTNPPRPPSSSGRSRRSILRRSPRRVPPGRRSSAPADTSPSLPVRYFADGPFRRGCVAASLKAASRRPGPTTGMLRRSEATL